MVKVAADANAELARDLSPGEILLYGVHALADHDRLAVHGGEEAGHLRG